jgi:hypothetical protein
MPKKTVRTEKRIIIPDNLVEDIQPSPSDKDEAQTKLRELINGRWADKYIQVIARSDDGKTWHMWHQPQS